MKLLFFPFLGYSHTSLHERVAGKTVLITGDSCGIGESLAESRAETGAHLLLVARTAEKLGQVKQRVEARGGRADIFPCDLIQGPRWTACWQPCSNSRGHRHRCQQCRQIDPAFDFRLA